MQPPRMDWMMVMETAIKWTRDLDVSAQAEKSENQWREERGGKRGEGKD
jgi:hypothetical protein